MSLCLLNILMNKDYFFLPVAKPTGHRIVRVVVVGDFINCQNCSLKYSLIVVCVCFYYEYIVPVFHFYEVFLGVFN